MDECTEFHIYIGNEDDECDFSTTTSSNIQRIVSGNQNVKFFIAGRPEMINRKSFGRLDSSAVQVSSRNVEAEEDVEWQ